MASPRWVGRARAVAQVNTWTPSLTWATNDTILFTYGSKTWTYTLTNGTIATWLPLLVTAYNALSATDYPEFAEQTASSTSTTFVLTADTAGKPFTVSLVETTAGNGVLDSVGGAATTVNAGPQNWPTAANWSTGSAPVDSDSIYLDDTADDIRYGIDTGITPALVVFGPNFSGDGGLPKVNSDGSASYPEYRPDYIRFVGGTLCTVNCQSRFLKLDAGSTSTTWNVLQTGRGSGGVEALTLKGTNSSNVLNVSGNSEVGVAVLGAETANLSGGVKVNGATVRCGSGVTLAAVVNDGGTLEVNGAIGTSLKQKGGETTINGTGAVALVEIRDRGRCIYNTTGALGGASILANGAVLDFSQDSRAKTVTNALDIFSDAYVNDPDDVVASLVQDFNGMLPKLENCGSNKRYTRAAVA